MNPRISVILPVYNGEKFILKALESVFAQDYPAHEIIVVNDGSTDSTDRVLEGMKKKIRYVSIPNGGVSNARNTGIRMAAGEYLAFLDADDLWFRSKLKVNAELIKAYPSVGCIFSDYIERVAYYGNRLIRRSHMVGNKDKIVLDRPTPFHPLNLFLLYDYSSTPSAVVVKKSLAEKVGLFDEKRKLVEDLDFYLRLALESQMVLSSKTLLYKYNHPNNLSNDNSRMFSARISAIHDFYQAHKDYLDKNGFKYGVGRSLARVHYMAGDLCFEKKDFAGTFSCYRKALLCTPDIRNILTYLSKNLKKIIRLLTFNSIGWKTPRISQ